MTDQEDTFPGGGGPPMVNAANAAQVKASTKLREHQRDERANDLRTVLQTAEGTRFVLRILNHTRAFQGIFDRDAMQMAHDSGVQMVGRDLIEWLGQADPEAFPRLLLFQLKQKADVEAARAQLIAKEKTT